MVIDAIVLAGGRSSRLGGVPKAGLTIRNRTLLEHAVDAVSFARATVVVGEAPGTLPAGTILAREEPPFGGPAAGVAAGLARLAQTQEQSSDFVFVLACDMPLVSASAAALREALGRGLASDGLIAVDADRHPQPLAAVYRTSSLTGASAELSRRGRLDGLSMFRLIATLSLTEISVPPGATDDVDTWEDAARFGITHPGKTEEP